jgi:glutamate 5-kinase
VLGFHTKNLRLDTKQALAAIGQIELSQLFSTIAKKHNLNTAQILLTLDDTEERKRYVNSSHTLRRLIELNVVPIINENDTTATSEIRYGDNDRLAARIAQMIHADVLVLLSDIDGLYTDDPRIHPNAEFIEQVEAIDSKILGLAKDSSTNYGSGGMITKIEAASIATNSGCAMLITLGKGLNPIAHYQQKQRGTWFLPNDTTINAKKRWLQEHLKSQGRIVVDHGAAKALVRGASLLPSGIISVSGLFNKGAPVDIIGLDQQLIARGLMNYAADELVLIMGKQSEEIAAILKYEGLAEVIHRDNLMLMKVSS